MEEIGEIDINKIITRMIIMVRKGWKIMIYNCDINNNNVAVVTVVVVVVMVRKAIMKMMIMIIIIMIFLVNYG